MMAGLPVVVLCSPLSLFSSFEFTAFLCFGSVEMVLIACGGRKEGKDVNEILDQFQTYAVLLQWQFCSVSLELCEGVKARRSKKRDAST